MIIVSGHDLTNISPPFLASDSPGIPLAGGVTRLEQGKEIPTWTQYDIAAIDCHGIISMSQLLVFLKSSSTITEHRDEASTACCHAARASKP